MERDRSGATFVVLYGAEPGKTIALDDGMVIGRSRSATVRFERDTLSRRHALLERRDTAFIIRDLGSMHGVWVNDERVTEQRLLDGDVVRLGELILKYLVDMPVCRPFVPSYLDALTGVASKRAYRAKLAEETSANAGLSLAWLDVDRMANFNYDHGHIAGDRALVQIARLVSDAFAPFEVARCKGDVFAAVLPFEVDARARADAARLAIAATPVVIEGVPLTVTVSGGVASVAPRAWATPADLEAVVDERLYAAKCAGRNRIV